MKKEEIKEWQNKFAKMFMEDFIKYGIIDKDGIMYFDDGIVNGRIGKIKLK